MIATCRRPAPTINRPACVRLRTPLQVLGAVAPPTARSSARPDGADYRASCRVPRHATCRAAGGPPAQACWLPRQPDRTTARRACAPRCQPSPATIAAVPALPARRTRHPPRAWGRARRSRPGRHATPLVPPAAARRRAVRGEAPRFAWPLARFPAPDGKQYQDSGQNTSAPGFLQRRKAWLSVIGHSESTRNVLTKRAGEAYSASHGAPSPAGAAHQGRHEHSEADGKAGRRMGRAGHGIRCLRLFPRGASNLPAGTFQAAHGPSQAQHGPFLLDAEASKGARELLELTGGLSKGTAGTCKRLTSLQRTAALIAG